MPGPRVLLLYALRGTPFIYQGEELGLPDAEIPPERVVDVDGRDGERAPLPWTATPPAYGFSTGEPWLPFVADAAELNVAAQAADPRSTLAFVRQLAALRRDEPVLQHGGQRFLDAGRDVLAWVRGDALVAAINFGVVPAPVDLDGLLVLSTDPDRQDGLVDALAPGEGVIVRL